MLTNTLSKRAYLPETPKRTNSLTPIMLGPLPDRPSVSILLSNYNYALYLVEAIESCLDQTYANFELIVSDDGSTDGSDSVISRYQVRDHRIKPIFQRNGGQAVALNAAFRASTGDVICLMDADDVFQPAKLQHVVEAFLGSPNSGFAVNKMLRVDKERKYLGEIPLLYQLPSGWLGPSLDLSVPELPAGLPPTSGLSLRRSIANIIFPLPHSLKAYADRLIQVVAPLMTPIVAIQTAVSEYRVHGANVGGVTQFSERHVRDLLSYDQAIWEAWHRYLASPYSGLSSDFSLSSPRCPSLIDYAYARFRCDRDFKTIYKAVPRAHLKTLPRPHRWYWQTSVLLPSWLFRMTFNFVHGQTRTKMFLGRILKACRHTPRLQNDSANSHATRYECASKTV